MTNDANKTVYASTRDGNYKTTVQLENFQADLRKIFAEDEEAKKKMIDEIPMDVRHQLDLPRKMGIYEVNFNEVKAQDIMSKKQLPMWSG
jgi:hypothetical protein